MGECLASLVLEVKDAFTRSPFCTRTLPALPPEPARYLAGSAIRRAILACEEAEEDGRRPAPLARAASIIKERYISLRSL